MKTITKIMVLLCGVAALSSCKKQNGTDPIDIEQHYKMVYMLGAAPGKWDSADPLPMEATDDQDIFQYQIDLVRSAENKLIKFTVSVDTWDKAKFLIPATVEDGQSYAYLKEGVNQLKLVQAVPKADNPDEYTVDDYFFGLDKGMSGTYLLKVNPVKLTLDATRLSTIDEPEIREWEEGRVYMVGDASPAGWDISQPTLMDKNGNIHTYKGILKTGELKFPTKYDWGGPTYMAPEADTEISKAGIKDGQVLYTETGNPDQKWKVVDEGTYEIDLDTENLTINVKFIQ
ncbi:MAG: SusF/SusE family outer membrane protein [Bacteroidales bacterium]|jgi:hypothetical protein|nr:SusF/SusE family outer membrane protein [Bacteroidales bacterium]MCI2122471.1 SusF/SusE family outer membrane protein [Bacteroidales bacterium]MCI2144830.1 SusF/SusE family outer membrane protein [Bacteroidales bacterium]